jgi:hypothetical protein
MSDQSGLISEGGTSVEEAEPSLFSRVARWFIYAFVLYACKQLFLWLAV